mgnify:CR=1 FL=1|tara:strand:- start:1133 stop:1342 length:210 start_codon:yes stop_codon:yes gene_type:complete
MVILEIPALEAGIFVFMAVKFFHNKEVDLMSCFRYYISKISICYLFAVDRERIFCYLLLVVKDIRIKLS